MVTARGQLRIQLVGDEVVDAVVADEKARSFKCHRLAFVADEDVLHAERFTSTGKNAIRSVPTKPRQTLLCAVLMLVSMA